MERRPSHVTAPASGGPEVFPLGPAGTVSRTQTAEETGKIGVGRRSKPRGRRGRPGQFSARGQWMPTGQGGNNRAEAPATVHAGGRSSARTARKAGLAPGLSHRNKREQFFPAHSVAPFATGNCRSTRRCRQTPLRCTRSTEHCTSASINDATNLAESPLPASHQYWGHGGAPYRRRFGHNYLAPRNLATASVRVRTCSFS